jgi:hypothetical protein
MKHKPVTKTDRALLLQLGLTAMVLSAGLASAPSALADDDDFFLPGNLLLSRVVYDNNPNNVTVGQQLPPNCVTGCVVAQFNGAYPTVFNNAPIDGSFGITSKIHPRPADAVRRAYRLARGAQQLAAGH